MKIKDIIVEQPSGYRKSFVSKAASPSQWGLGGDPDYEAGKSFASKVFSPSQWFRGSGQPSSQQSSKTGSKPIDHVDLGNKKSFEIRRNLDNIASGQYYASDISVAKNIRDQIKAGSFKPAVDIESTIITLDKVINRAPLSKEDQERIKKLKTATKNLN